MASSPTAVTRLQRRQWVALARSAGHRVECVEGALWVTQDDDARDTVLRPGDSFLLDRPGTAIVSALGDAAFIVTLPVPEPAPLPATPRFVPNHRENAPCSP